MIGRLLARLGLGYKGGELLFGRNVRLNLLGTRRRPCTWPERLPHDHRRGRPDARGRTPPGQGVGRHRPWEASAHDGSVWDRF